MTVPSGDDIDAKAEVSPLFEDAGFFPIDLGGGDHGRRGATAGASLANLVRLSEGNSYGRACATSQASTEALSGSRISRA